MPTSQQTPGISTELRTLGESKFPEGMQDFLRNFDLGMHNTLGSFTWGARNARLLYAGMQKSGDTEFPVTPATDHDGQEK